MRTAKKIISDSTLICCMEDLRNALKAVGQIDTKVIFINLESFYSYISEFQGNNGKNVEELLSLIEPFIPVIVTDQNIDLFLNAAISSDEQALQEMENNLVCRSKIKFIKSVMEAETEHQWNELVDICRTIRSYKEQGIVI